MKNINKKRTSKLLIVLNMLMLIALIAVPTYAFYWNERKVDINEDIVSGTVTEGLVVVTPGALLNSDKKLIPLSAEFTAVTSEVKELVYTITVGLDINEKLNEENLKVSVTDFGFLTYVVSKTQEGNNVIVTITFTIGLSAGEWTSAHNNVTHNVKVKLSLDPIV